MPCVVVVADARLVRHLRPGRGAGSGLDVPGKWLVETAFDDDIAVVAPIPRAPARVVNPNAPRPPTWHCRSNARCEGRADGRG